ncbi:hypothetical protein ACIQBJ_25310 [Kitasatospora sp. NPDC088391]
MRRWSIAGVRKGAVPLYPRGLGVLMEGYVDGWVSDGPITLQV